MTHTNVKCPGTHCTYPGEYIPTPLTLEELLEAITLKRLGLFLGPIVLVNTRGYYDPLLSQLATAIDGRFMDVRHGALWSVVTEPQAVLHAIETAPEWSAANRAFAVTR